MTFSYDSSSTFLSIIYGIAIEAVINVIPSNTSDCFRFAVTELDEDEVANTKWTHGAMLYRVATPDSTADSDGTENLITLLKGPELILISLNMLSKDTAILLFSDTPGELICKLEGCDDLTLEQREAANYYMEAIMKHLRKFMGGFNTTPS